MRDTHPAGIADTLRGARVTRERDLGRTGAVAAGTGEVGAADGPTRRWSRRVALLARVVQAVAAERINGATGVAGREQAGLGIDEGIGRGLERRTLSGVAAVGAELGLGDPVEELSLRLAGAEGVDGARSLGGSLCVTAPDRRGVLTNAPGLGRVSLPAVSDGRVAA